MMAFVNDETLPQVISINYTDKKQTPFEGPFVSGAAAAIDPGGAACSCPQEPDPRESVDTDAENAKLRRRNRSPLFFCTFIVTNPRLSFGKMLFYI